MADNTTISDGLSGTITPATDKIGGVDYQRVKFSIGDDGTAVDCGPSNPLPVIQRAATPTLANVAGSASSVTLQAANAARKGLVIVNDSTSVLYVSFGATASATSYTYYLAGSVSGVPSTLELPTMIYTGIVTGIWASATGTARITELS